MTGLTSQFRRSRRWNAVGSATMRQQPFDELVDALRADDTVTALVAGRPARQRLTVTYRYLGDLSYQQVAERIGCSVPAARRSAADGIASLRRRVAASSTLEDHDGRT